jgi:hypothetical protein
VDLTPHQLAWIFIALGIFVLAWAGHDLARGQTHVESTDSFLGTPVQKESDPKRFRRLIMTSAIGGLVCVGFRVGLLVVA